MKPAPLLLRAPSFEKKIFGKRLWLAVVTTQRLKITQQTIEVYETYFECIRPGKGKGKGKGYTAISASEGS